MRRSSTPRGRLLLGLTLLAVVAAAASGCRQGSFLGNRYNNFRAYYNTFYNARKSFEDGEEQLLQLDEPVDRSRFLPVFADVPAEATTPGTGTTSGPFQDAIDKSADLLRERPTSKWADDALLLIGRSYFYQRNLVGAEEKFRETIAAAEERGQEGLVDEARYWLGRTLAAQQRYEEADVVLEEGLARDGLSRYWRARMQLALAEQYVQQRAWEQAADALRAGLADIRDSDLAGRACFLLGQILEAKGDYDGAAEAYAAVEDHRPYYELLYAAQLSRALVLGLYAGRHDEALALIRQMRRDDKHFQNRAEVELAYARLLAAAGRNDEARERFETLLYEPEAFAGAAVPRDRVHYYYGAFYRDQLNDYVRAAAYLDTAATGLRTDPGREALLTHAALTGVRREADAFKDYAAIATQMAEADSLLDLGALDDDAYAARVEAIEEARRIAWEAEQRRLQQLQAQAGFEGGPVGVTGGNPYENRPPTGGGTPGVDAGFLNYRDVARIQDALVSFQAVWGDRPLVPNWRRRQAIGGALASAENPEVGSTGGLRQGRSPGGPPPLDWTNVPRTAEARAALLTERASLRYELGNVLFLSLARPDSAAYWYNRVVEQDAAEPVAARALYALAEVRREQGRTAEAEALYRRLLDLDPEGDLAAAARERLGLPPLEDAAADETAARAAAAYDGAYARWRRGDYPAAVRGFLDLAAVYGATDQAPRALIAASDAFAEWAQRDTLTVERGIPLELVPPALLDSMATSEAEAPPAEAPEAAPPAPAAGEQEVETLQDAAEPVEEDEDAVQPSEDDPLGLGDDALPDETDGEEAADDEGEPPLPPDAEVPEPASEDEGVTESEAAPALAPAPEPAPEPEPVEGREEAPVAAPPDTVSTPADSAVAIAAAPLVADTTAALADTTLAAADSTVAPPTLPLTDLLAYVEAQYPGTPYAEHARARRTALLALYAPEALPDTTTAPAEEAPAEEAVVGLPAAPPDASLPSSVVSLLPPETFGLEGARTLNPGAGGFAWRVAATTDAAAALALLQAYAEQGLRTAAVEETGEGYSGYAILVGQFASVAQAEAVRDALPASDAEAPPRVVALSGLQFLQEADLRRAQAEAPQDSGAQ